MFIAPESLETNSYKSGRTGAFPHGSNEHTRSTVKDMNDTLYGRDAPPRGIHVVVPDVYIPLR
jgi:hypothetical protein